MAKPSSPEPALLFAGILYHDTSYLEKAKDTLLKLFGPALKETPSFDWDHSDYYREEIGGPIKKTYLFFKKLISPEEIVDIKLKTNDIENSLSVNGKRKVNLDPGYLTRSKIVLATQKNYSHRLYLSKGIYGEVTLIFKDKTYIPHIFTYTDYQDPKYIEIFIDARKLLIKEIS